MEWSYFLGVLSGLTVAGLIGLANLLARKRAELTSRTPNATNEYCAPNGEGPPKQASRHAALTGQDLGGEAPPASDESGRPDAAPRINERSDQRSP